MGQGDWVTLRQVRREIDDDVLKALEPLEEAGWRLRRQGHKFGLYCPCGPGGTWVRVDGSPKNPRTALRRIRQQVALCPDQHDLIHPSVSS